MTRTLTACFLVASLFTASMLPTASAYDSRCFLASGTECKPGPPAAQNRWRRTSSSQPLGEHRELFQKTLNVSGVPAGIASAFTVRVYTDGSTAGNSPPLKTARAQRFDKETAAVSSRTMTVPEFAQLPDFSYALWDWASGNELCPLGSAVSSSVSAEACHTFESHMGATNANHFVPQAQRFFLHYHALALAVAQQCKAMREALAEAKGRFDNTIKACEKHAFVIEAVGHHFLQDAWSSGHMWERWGSSDPNKMPSLAASLMVAMTSGLIHGARAVFQSIENPLTISEFNDPLCAPHVDVRYRAGTSLSLVKGVGDLYLDILLNDEGYVQQRKQLFACAVSSLRQVYLAMADSNKVASHGPLQNPGSGVGSSIDPTSSACFGQRVTNQAMDTAMGVHFSNSTSGVQDSISLLAAAGFVAPIAAANANTPVWPPSKTWDQIAKDLEDSSPAFALSLLAVAAKAKFFATITPNSTSMASGGLPDLLGVKPNSAYANANPLVPYIDPPLPWTPAANAGVQNPGAATALAFHHAHATQWCKAATDNTGPFALRKLQQAALALTPGSAQHNLACDRCTLFAGRHVRLGPPTSWDKSHEPLCGYLAPNDAVFFYVYTKNPADAPKYWCGCGAYAPSLLRGQELIFTPTGGGSKFGWSFNDQGKAFDRYGGPTLGYTYSKQSTTKATAVIGGATYKLTFLPIEWPDPIAGSYKRTSDNSSGTFILGS